MKIRNGFVSNSSTSSFVVAVKKDASKQYDALKLIDIFLNKFEVNKKKISQEIKEVKDEIRELEKDIKYLDRLIDDLKEVPENFVEIVDKSHGLSNDTAIRNSRDIDEYMSSEDYRSYESRISVKERKLGYLDFDRKSLNSKIQNLNLKLEKIKDLKDEYYELISTECDVCYSSLRPLFEELQKKKLAIILREKTS